MDLLFLVHLALTCNVEFVNIMCLSVMFTSVLTLTEYSARIGSQLRDLLF